MFFFIAGAFFVLMDVCYELTELADSIFFTVLIFVDIGRYLYFVCNVYLFLAILNVYFICIAIHSLSVYFVLEQKCSSILNSLSLAHLLVRPLVRPSRFLRQQ